MKKYPFPMKIEYLSNNRIYNALLLKWHCPFKIKLQHAIIIKQLDATMEHQT